jgi:hypothetical protein
MENIMNLRSSAMRSLPPRLALCIAIVLASACAPASAQPAGPAAIDKAFEAAMLAYEHNHWQDAFAAMTALADSGHREAARIALQMRRHGQALYGIAFAASDDQLQRWMHLVSCTSGAPCAPTR